MTITVSGLEVTKLIKSRFPDAVSESTEMSATVKSDYLLPVLSYLKTAPETSFDYLTDLTAVDYCDYFEVLYRLTSLGLNQTALIKTRCPERDKAVLPSVTGLWKGADYMERELFDLMGIRFTGHPNMKRIFLWEGFSGYPLRKDYL
jgi:NADH-quinone oxidoreductase subunit C